MVSVLFVGELWLLGDSKLEIYGNRRSSDNPKHCNMGRRSPFLKGAGSNIYFEDEQNQRAVSEECYVPVQRNLQLCPCV